MKSSHFPAYISAGEKFNTVAAPVPAPLFKRKFPLPDGEGDLSVEITAVGLYRLFINGEEITKGFLAPYISNPDRVVYKDVYKIDGSALREQNELCVLLGNGFCNCNDNGIWDFDKAVYRAAPKFRLAAYRGGECVFFTPDGFLVADSPITFDDLRHGERYDARLENKYVWRTPVVADPPKGEVRENCPCTVSAHTGLGPTRIIKSGGGFIYDFGREFSGVCLLKICGREGQRVKITYGETVIDGKLDLDNITFGGREITGPAQVDEYICREGYQTHLPSFTYHGFRYALAEGVDESQATEELLTFVPVHSDIETCGGFACSDEIINAVQKCAVASDISNFHFYPTDCPQREKNGWTGDITLSAEQFLYNLDCADELREWLFNVRKAQREDGKIPAIVPTDKWGYEGCGGPAWDGVIIELCYQLYRFTGDESVLYENAAAIEKYLGYLFLKINGEGLIAECLGDWCETGTEREWQYSTPLDIVDTLVTVGLCEKVIEICKIINDGRLAKTAKELADGLESAFRKKYMKGGALTVKTQTALALALSTDILKGGERQRAQSNLIAAVHAQNDSFKVGVIGARHLFYALTDAGESALAYKLIANRAFPGYGYWIEHGATTLWESFNELDDSADGYKRKDGLKMLSLNHHFWGSVSGWFYKVLAGIDVQAGKKITLSPQFVEEAGKVEATYKNAHGRIAVTVDRADGGVLLTVDNEGFEGEVVLGRGTPHEKKTPLKTGKSQYLMGSTARQ